ncbi:EF-hand domain-containing protein [Rhodopirellula sp. JC639]|uniref:EF-hand domain-containing protein n=1 Tax=Stieleria mannarensis TaxID=2755585 RepID=UPI001603FDA0|nr:hypothetical protein [Rhodopirellula sp. JC639]
MGPFNHVLAALVLSVAGLGQPSPSLQAAEQPAGEPPRTETIVVQNASLQLGRMNPPSLAPSSLLFALDVDRNGILTQDEIAGASLSLAKLDTNLDGQVTTDEWRVEERDAWIRGRWNRNRDTAPGRSPTAELITADQFVQQVMRLDVDRDGEIGSAELTNFLRPLLPFVDQNGNGGIDSDEATTLYHSLKGMPNRQQLFAASHSRESVEPALLEQTISLLSEQQSVEVEVQSHIDGRKTTQALLYWFTVGAMFLSILGFGHLLNCPPKKQTGWRDVSDDHSAGRHVICSVAFIAGLSVIDLVWTILASGSGHFIELNPVGSELLGDYSIAIFKLLTLALTITLFLRLRHFRGAQIGSWWMCLVCTLVTWRWLVSESMFIE